MWMRIHSHNKNALLIYATDFANESGSLSKSSGKHFWIPAFAGMTIRNNCLILYVIPSEAGIQVQASLNQLPVLFEKLLNFTMPIIC